MPSCGAWSRANAEEVLAVVTVAWLLLTVISRLESQIPHTLRSSLTALLNVSHQLRDMDNFYTLTCPFHLPAAAVPLLFPSSLGEAQQSSASSSLTLRPSLQHRPSFADWSVPSSSPWEGNPAPDGSWMSCRFLCLSLREAEGTTVGPIQRGVAIPVFCSLFLLASKASVFHFLNQKSPL